MGKLRFLLCVCNIVIVYIHYIFIYSNQGIHASNTIINTSVNEQRVRQLRPEWNYIHSNKTFKSTFFMRQIHTKLFKTNVIRKKVMDTCKNLNIPGDSMIISLLVIKDNNVNYWSINFNTKTITNEYEDNALISVCIDDIKLRNFLMAILVTKNKSPNMKKLIKFYFEPKGSIQIKPFSLAILFAKELHDHDFGDEYEVKGHQTGLSISSNNAPEIQNNNDNNNESNIENNSAIKPVPLRDEYKSIERVREEKELISRYELGRNSFKFNMYNKGKKFWYDKWNRKQCRGNYIIIETKYQDLKDELINNELRSESIDVWNTTVKNLKNLKINNAHIICKLVACIDSSEEKKYKIKNGTNITDMHLIALKLYSDNTELCFKLRQTYYDEEYFIEQPNGEIIYKHTELANLGRLLHESCAIYGKRIPYDKTVYMGLTLQLLFDLFAHQFFTYLPMSTTTDVEVAKMFAGFTGMVIALRCYDGKSKYIDMKCVSKFTGEKEYFFCGNSTWQLYYEDMTQMPNMDQDQWNWKGMNLIEFNKSVRKLVRNWKSLLNDKILCDNMDTVCDVLMKAKDIDIERKDKDIERKDKDIERKDKDSIEDQKKKLYNEINLEYGGYFDRQIKTIFDNIRGRLLIVELNGWKKLLPKFYTNFVDDKYKAIQVSKILKLIKNITSLCIGCSGKKDDGIIIEEKIEEGYGHGYGHSLAITINDIINNVINKSKLQNLYMKYNIESQPHFREIILNQHKRNLNAYNWDMIYDINKCWIFIYDKEYPLLSDILNVYLFGSNDIKCNNTGEMGIDMMNMLSAFNVLKYNFEDHKQLYNALQGIFSFAYDLSNN